MLAPWQRILLPALVTFLAGFLVGQAFQPTESTKGLEELPADLLAYADGMIEALSLDPPQADDLRILLFHYERERGRLLEQRLAEVDEEWVSLDQRFESLLATRILRSDQRRTADALRDPSTVALAAAPR
ncbi:MAG: hypothetical protein ACYTEP_02560 [Planctomycetota bacterium]|jgi:hypothetical protein